MADGRAPDLQFQAFDAILGHAEAGRVPDDDELEAIAHFQRTAARFFSSPALRRYARRGVEPTLPEGSTASEKRGRAFFVDGGSCSGCHGGPMLNQTRSGRRFLSAGVSERNRLGNPVYRFVVKNDSGDGETILESPDPGRALITGDLADANHFKISPLWGISKTAPYFHDNSAATLEEVASHYDEFFESRGLPGLSADDQADLVAYMKLL